MPNLPANSRHVQNDQIKAAIVSTLSALEKFGEWDDGCFYYNGHSASELQQPIRDLTAALASLAASEAKRISRELPIDDEWLRSIGFDGPYKDRPRNVVMLEVLAGGYLSWSDSDCLRLCDLDTGLTTRGQLLDLLAALGVPHD